jgi:hypothetical protein
LTARQSALRAGKRLSSELYGLFGLLRVGIAEAFGSVSD